MALAAIFFNSTLVQSVMSMQIARIKCDVAGYTPTIIDTAGLDEAGITTAIDTITNTTMTAIYVSCTTASTHSAGVMTYDQVAYLDIKLITASKGTSYAAGTCQSNSTTTYIKIAADSSASNDYYNGKYIKTAGSTVVYRYISDYTGSSTTAVVTDTSTAITTTETYIIFTLNKVYLIGDADSSENACRVAWTALFPTKQVPMIVALMGGSGTGFAPYVEVTRTSGGGSHSTTTLADTGHFTADKYNLKWVGIESGTLGVGQVRQITDSTADALTVALWTAPTGTVVYQISDTYEFCLANKYLPLAIMTYLYATDNDTKAIWRQLVDKYNTLAKATPSTVGDLALLVTYCQRGKCIFDADTLSVV